MTFGNRLRRHRLKNGFTQAQLGDKLGLSASAIGMYEQNRRTPDLQVLMKMSHLFHITPDELLQPTSPESVAITDIHDIIDDTLEHLVASNNYIYNGHMLTRQQLIKIAEGMRLGAHLALHQLEG